MAAGVGKSYLYDINKYIYILYDIDIIYIIYIYKMKGLFFFSKLEWDGGIS